MGAIDSYEVAVYGPESALPESVEDLLGSYLAESRAALGAGGRTFVMTCALAPDGTALGAVLLDLAPLPSGPLAGQRIAYLERTIVRPESRRQGIATRLLKAAIAAAADAGCWYIRCSNNWDNPAERALFLRCGFVLIDNTDDPPGDEPCYQAVRPLRGEP